MRTRSALRLGCDICLVLGLCLWLGGCVDPAPTKDADGFVRFNKVWIE